MFISFLESNDFVGEANNLQRFFLYDRGIWPLLVCYIIYLLYLLFYKIMYYLLFVFFLYICLTMMHAQNVMKDIADGKRQML